MTLGQMRKPSASSSSFKLLQWRSPRPLVQQWLIREDLRLSQPALRRSLAQVRPEPLSEIWFTSSAPRRSPADDFLGPSAPSSDGDRKTDERALKLGKTLRALSTLLPKILTTPLPPEIVSPSVSLHLFPSTHPHLPTVRGRMSYRAALWTAPVAWGCVPIVGNVKLRILSEKVVRTGFVSVPHSEDKPDLGEEKLVVRWETEKKDNGGNTTEAQARSTTTDGNINRGLSTLLGGDKPIFNLNKSDDFSGLFVFSFDSKGRIATHTIEHSDESNGLDRTSKVVTLTDWLLGKAKWGASKEEELVPGLAMRVCKDQWARDSRIRRKSERLW